MKMLLAVTVLVNLAACGTVQGTTAGLLDGASRDLQSLSELVKGKDSK